MEPEINTGWNTTRLVGLVMAGVLVAAIALVGAVYNRAFVSELPVTVRADRSGLLMDPGNRVTMRGIEVGRVNAVRADGDGAVLSLGLDPDQLSWIPGNAVAQIVPSTVFGTKYVSLTAPAQPSGPIKAGTVLANQHVTTEVDNVFDKLASVLRSVDVAKLNTTLGETAEGLSGRGAEISALARTADTYLDRLNPKLPTLQRDLAATSKVTNLYADVSPDLLRTLANLTVTGRTLVDEQEPLRELLPAVRGTAENGERLLDDNGNRLIELLDRLRPTTELLRRYSPELTCFVKGLDEDDRMLSQAVGGTNPGLNLDVSIVPGHPAYRYPDDLPEIKADRGPHCNGLPKLGQDQLPASFVPTDTGTNPYPAPNNRPSLGAPPLAPLLFGPIAPSRPVPAQGGTR